MQPAVVRSAPQGIHLADVGTLVRSALLEGLSQDEAIQRVSNFIISKYSLSELERLDRELKSGNYTASVLAPLELKINTMTYHMCSTLYRRKADIATTQVSRSAHFTDFVAKLRFMMQKECKYLYSMRQLANLFNKLSMKTLGSLLAESKENRSFLVIPKKILYADGVRKEKKGEEVSYESLTAQCLVAVILWKKQAKVEAHLEDNNVEDALAETLNMPRQHWITDETYTKIIHHLLARQKVDRALNIAEGFLRRSHKSLDLIEHICEIKKHGYPTLHFLKSFFSCASR